MASIKLKSNQEVILRLKACGLTNSEIKKIMEALTPMIEEKADKSTTLSGYGIEDAYTQDEIHQVVDERISYPIGEIAFIVDKKAEKDLSNVDNEIFKAKAEKAGIGGSGGAVFSVNGKTGKVKLKLEDINDMFTADTATFQYKLSESAKFHFGYDRIAATGDANGGYNFEVDSSGLYVSGNPYCNNDITLVQNNWVDENDQSQGVVTTTHKLSEKIDKSEVHNMIGDIDVALEGIIELQLQHGAWIEIEGDTNVGGNTGEPPSVDLPEYEGDD